MHIKRFQGRTVDEALARVRAEFGPDALILSTQHKRSDEGVFGWFGRAAVEVTAAIDRELRKSGDADPRPASESSAPAPARHDSWRALSVTRALVDPLEREVRDLRRSIERMSRLAASEDELRRGIADVRRVLEGPHDAFARAGGAEAAPTDRLARALEHRGLDAVHALRIAGDVDLERREGESELRCARRLLLRELDVKLVPVRPSARGAVALFVGAPGSGKTTCVAKLAGQEIETDVPSVLLSLDSWRATRDHALRTLAAEHDLTFASVLSPAELAQRAADLGERRALVDTAGRGRKDAGAIPELLACKEALGRRAFVVLVAQATTKASDLRAQVARFSELAPDALVLTHLDETDDLANVLNVVLDPQTPPLAWISTGQRVPEDLEIPRPEWLASALTSHRGDNA